MVSWRLIVLGLVAAGIAGNAPTDSYGLPAGEPHANPPGSARLEPAVPLRVECCVGENSLRNLGLCLGGPDVGNPPEACDPGLSCVMDFAEPVEPDDALYALCESDDAQLPTTGTETCVLIEDEPFEPAFSCRTADVPGVSLFSLFDADQDGDFDLRDYAAYQYSLAIPTP